MYSIGDLVVYNQLCVCEILGEESMIFEPFGRKNYYKLRPYFGAKRDSLYYVPVEHTGALRKVVTESEANEILQSVPNEKICVNNIKKPLMLAAYYREKFEQGGLKESLLILKEIWLKEKVNVKKLNETDIKYRSRAEKIALEELCVALNKEESEIKPVVENLIKG